MEAARIDAKTAHDHLESGRAVLVCGYDDEEKFCNAHLEGAMRFQEFSDRADNFRNREVIFYCAWPHEATSARRAEQFQGRGFKHVFAMKDGVKGWAAAGYRVVPPEECGQ